MIGSARVCICLMLLVNCCTCPGVTARDIQEALYKRDIVVQDLTLKRSSPA
jgi:hypothetical protein